MIEYEPEEEAVMIALHDLLKDDGDGGLLDPTLFSIQDKVDMADKEGKERLTEILRRLHEKGHVKSSEAFRPRHPDPAVYITPEGWEKLDEMGREIPEKWVRAQRDILEILYLEEKENWHDPTGRVYVSLSEIEEQIEMPKGILDVVLSYLVEIEFIGSVERGYVIKEDGARAYEEDEYSGKTRAFQ